MGKVGEKRGSAAAAQHSDGSEGEALDTDAKRRGSVRTPPSRPKGPMNVLVVAGNKAAAPGKAAAANASVVNKAAPPPKAAAANASAVVAAAPQKAAAANGSAVVAHTGTDTAKPSWQYDNFELQMKLIQQDKPSTTVVTSPVQFGSPGRPKTSSKVWVAGLRSGEMVAYVTDRYKPESPAFIKIGLDKFRQDPSLCEKAMVSEMVHKKADKAPFKAWTQAKTSIVSQSAYTLYWFVLVRRFEDLKDHTPEARTAWGGSLANYFERTDTPNKFEYGGDLSKDQACPASDFFKVEDVMQKFILQRLAGQMVESEIVKNSHLMVSYYGDDPVFNSQVTQFYTPQEQQPKGEAGVGQEEANPNQELCGLFEQ